MVESTFFLKTGKNLVDASTEIHVIFKQIAKKTFGASGLFDPNILTIAIAPNSGISLTLNTQEAGKLNCVTSVPLEFCYKCSFGTGFPKAYEVLLTEILTDNRTIAVSPTEIEHAWRIIDTIKQKQFPLFFYEPGTNGPMQADSFIKKKKRTWRL